MDFVQQNSEASLVEKPYGRLGQEDKWFIILVKPLTWLQSAHSAVG